MALSNSQFNDLMHRYDERQIEREREIEARTKRLHSVIPNLKVLEEELRYAYIASARVSGSDLISTEEKIKKLESEISKTIESAGFPADYLDVPYTCPDCKDKGIVDGVKCHCFIKASNALLFSQSNMEKRLQHNLSDFRIDLYDDGDTDISGRTSRQSAEVALNVAHKFVQDFPKGTNLYIYGNTGTGKTHLSCCIATEIIEKGFSAIFIKASDFIDLCYQRFSDKDGSKAAMYDKLTNCELLVLDDLGADITTKNSDSLVLTLIDNRLNSGLSTIITSNIDIIKLKDAYSERVSSRIMGDYKNFHFFGADLRTKRI